MKRILVMMSTYNGQDYLREQISSILCQEKVEVHILIRDDGSVDSTLVILSGYNDNRIKVVTASNVGAAQSFFELIKIADYDYDYYAFSDQDDVWKKEKLFAAISKLDKVEDFKPSLYYSGQILVDSNLKFLFRHNVDNNRSVYANFIYNQMAGCTAVFNRELMHILKSYTPKNVYMHDAWVYKVCAVFDGNIIVDKDEYILYRQHNNNSIGLKKGIIGKKRLIVSHLLNEPSKYAIELKTAYDKNISREWNDFLEIIIENGNILNRIKLLFSKKIKFNSLRVRLVYDLKVLFYRF